MPRLVPLSIKTVTNNRHPYVHNINSNSTEVPGTYRNMRALVRLWGLWSVLDVMIHDHHPQSSSLTGGSSFFFFAAAAAAARCGTSTPPARPTPATARAVSIKNVFLSPLLGAGWSADIIFSTCSVAEVAHSAAERCRGVFCRSLQTREGNRPGADADGTYRGYRAQGTLPQHTINVLILLLSTCLILLLILLTAVVLEGLCSVSREGRYGYCAAFARRADCRPFNMGGCELDVVRRGDPTWGCGR